MTHYNYILNITFSDELYHGLFGKARSSHKYIDRIWKNGKWRYVYVNKKKRIVKSASDGVDKGALIEKYSGLYDSSKTDNPKYKRDYQKNPGERNQDHLPSKAFAEIFADKTINQVTKGQDLGDIIARTTIQKYLKENEYSIHEELVSEPAYSYNFSTHKWEQNGGMNVIRKKVEKGDPRVSKIKEHLENSRKKKID